MDELSFNPELNKQQVIKQIIDQIIAPNGLSVKYTDDTRPWGAFFAFLEADTSKFAKLFFPDIDQQEFADGLPRSPKFLIIEPHKRLSWQYHNRRSELWSVLAGPISVTTQLQTQSEQTTMLDVGQNISLDCGQLHRGVGLERWGLIAEIWKHVDPKNLSDEDDIVRVSDDFGR